MITAIKAPNNNPKRSEGRDNGGYSEDAPHFVPLIMTGII